MNVIATSALTHLAEACWDCLPLRVAIIVYVAIAAFFAVLFVIAGVMGTTVPSDRRGSANGEGLLIVSAIIGLLWPFYISSWLRDRTTPGAPAPAPVAPVETPASPVLTSPRGFEVVTVPAVKRDCCPECRQPFGGRKPIRWRDTRVCPECREHLRVLD